MGTLLDLASLVVVPSGYKEDKIYSVVPTDGSGDLDFTRASNATRVNSAGLIESVATDVPRLDYSQGSCPSLLLEPQRTNLALYSEQFDNAAWVKTNVTVTANDEVAPDGETTADKIIENSSLGGHFVRQILSLPIGEYIFSVFAKYVDRRYIVLRTNTEGGIYKNACFDLVDGVIVFDGLFGNKAKIEAFNDYFRISAQTRETSVVARNYEIYLSDSEILDNSEPTYTGDGTSSVVLWGAQLEEGAYPTSYIPTLGTSVTRVADAASKTGISDLIGQTEGTLFFEFNSKQLTGSQEFIGINDGTEDNRIIIFTQVNNSLILQVRASGVAGVSIQTPTLIENTNYKVAVAYKENDVSFYMNGTQIGTDNSTLIPLCSVFSLDDGDNARNFFKPLKQAILFKTRLSNTELAQLTTI